MRIHHKTPTFLINYFYLYLGMLNKKLLSLFFLFFGIFNGLSDNPKVIDTLEIHNQIKLFGINEEVLNFKTHFFGSIVFKNDSTIFYNPNGTLHLFKIHLGDKPKVSKISTSVHSGHNFNRLLFTNNDIIYSFGGIGLFNSFPGLIYFDFALGEWLKKEIKNYPDNAKKIISSWKIGNKIKFLFSRYSEVKGNDTNELTDFSFGELDLSKFEYIELFSFKDSYTQLLYTSELDLNTGGYIYDSDFYSIHGYHKDDDRVEYLIFDKIKGTLNRTSILDAIGRVNGVSYLYIKDSSIYHRDLDGNIESFDINSGSIIHSRPLYELYKSKVNNTLFYFIVTTTIIIVCSLFLFFYRRKKKKLSNSSIQNLLVLEKKFLTIKPTTIPKEKLDELMGISHYSYETIKTRRSLIINQINQNGNLKIERVRKENDKRFFDYKIS